MIRILPFVGAIALPVLLHAQPLIDQSNAPAEGDMFTYTAASYDTITLAGSDVVWDLSGIQPGSTSNLTIEDPAATQYGNLYPTSQIAVDAGTAIVYMRADATGLNAVGTRVWHLLLQHQSIEAAVPLLLQEFDVEEQQLRRDLDALVAELLEKTLLVAAEAAA